MSIFSKIYLIIKKITSISIKYLIYGSYVSNDNAHSINIGHNVKIVKSKILISRGNKIIIGNNVTIKRCNIYVNGTDPCYIEIGSNCCLNDCNIYLKGNLKIGDYTIIEKGNQYKNIDFLLDGTIKIGTYNRILSRIWTRYNSNLNIGNHNNINEFSEIRCDENINIGDYNQISYNVMIWDTNTHNIYTADIRRALTDSKYPSFGYEYEKPKTSPVTIGSDNWIGKNVSILKGTEIANKCIIGYSTVLSNIKLENNKTIVTSYNYKILDNKI